MTRDAWKSVLVMILMVAVALCVAGCPSGSDEPARAVDAPPPPPAADLAPDEGPADGQKPQPAQVPPATEQPAPPEAEATQPQPAAPEAPPPEPKPVQPKPEPAPAQAKPPPPVTKLPTPTATLSPAASAPAPPEQSRPGAAGTVVVGRITVASHVPDPSEVPYTECLTFIKYTVEEVQSGEYPESELLAVYWGMRDSKLQPAAKFAPGQRHALTIEPLSAHPELSRVMQADDTNEYALTPQWVVKRSSK
jgi:hypothetical protein